MCGSKAATPAKKSSNRVLNSRLGRPVDSTCQRVFSCPLGSSPGFGDFRQQRPHCPYVRQSGIMPMGESCLLPEINVLRSYGLLAVYGLPRVLGSPWFAILVIVAAVLAGYANSFQCPFVFDNQRAIVDNPTIRQLWPIGKPSAAQPRWIRQRPTDLELLPGDRLQIEFVHLVGVPGYAAGGDCTVAASLGLLGRLVLPDPCAHIELSALAGKRGFRTPDVSSAGGGGERRGGRRVPCRPMAHAPREDSASRVAGGWGLRGGLRRTCVRDRRLPRSFDYQSDLSIWGTRSPKRRTIPRPLQPRRRPGRPRTGR